MQEQQLARLIADYEMPPAATAARYQRIAAAMLGSDKTIASVGGYAEARAALVYHAVCIARNLLAIDQDCRTPVQQAQLDDAARFLTLLPPGGGSGLTYRGPRSTKVQRKRRIRDLPDDWRDQLFECIVERFPQAVPAAAVLELTGLRPSELAKGVVIRRTPSGALSLEIEGAKVSATRGQPQREIVVRASHARAAWLLQLLDFLGRDSATITLPRQPLHAVITAAACEAFPMRPEHLLPTPRTYRDQLSADLKLVHPPQDVATVLGHVAERSQQAYAGSRHARGLVDWLSHASASREIHTSSGLPFERRPLVSSGRDPA